MRNFKALVPFVGMLFIISCNDDFMIPHQSETTNPKGITKKSGGDGLFDILGYGCDPTQAYLASGFSQTSVIDIERLIAERPNDIVSHEPPDISGYIIAGSDAENWSSKLKYVFKGLPTHNMLSSHIETDIIANRKISSEYSYATYFHKVYRKNLQIVSSNETLKNYINPWFIEYLNRISCEEIIKIFGTHFFTHIYTGGRLQINYKAIINANTKEQIVNAELTNLAFNVFSINATNAVSQGVFRSSKTYSCYYNTYGGSLSLFGSINSMSPVANNALSAWTNSVADDNSVIIEIGENSLIPIYEIIPDPIKAEEFRIASINYLNSRSFQQYDQVTNLFGFGPDDNNKATALDYNGDGLEDLFFYSPGKGYAVLNEALGEGAFRNKFNYQNGLAGYNFRGYHDQAISLDYDGDSIDDLMCFRPGSKYVYILKSNGDGSFTKVFSSSNGIGGFNFSSKFDKAIILDFNKDGLDDILCYRPGNRIVYLLKSNGDGTFIRTYSSSNGIAGYNFSSNLDKAIRIDYNGDGFDDIMCYRPGAKIVYLLKNEGNGTFIRDYSSSNGIGGFNFSSKDDRVISLDYNGDGVEDLLCYRPGTKIAHLLKSNGNTSFANILFSTSGLAGFDLSQKQDRIVCIDYNGDDKDDILLYRPGWGIAYTATSIGNGSYELEYPYKRE